MRSGFPRPSVRTRSRPEQAESIAMPTALRSISRRSGRSGYSAAGTVAKRTGAAPRISTRGVRPRDSAALRGQIMKIPIGLTYLTHAVMALVLLAVSAVTLPMKLGTIDFGSGQALGTLLGMAAAIPCAISLLVAA